jgi:hypothetical protein
MKPPKIIIQNWGDYGSQWEVSRNIQEIGLKPFFEINGDFSYEVINQKLFDYAIIKYEISYSKVKPNKLEL